MRWRPGVFGQGSAALTRTAGFHFSPLSDQDPLADIESGPLPGTIQDLHLPPSGGDLVATDATNGCQDHLWLMDSNPLANNDQNMLDFWMEDFVPPPTASGHGPVHEGRQNSMPDMPVDDDYFE